MVDYLKNLEIKSKGTLIDEFLTAELKTAANPTPENVDRKNGLRLLLVERVYFKYDQDILHSLIHQLEIIVKQCWSAQEIVMNYQNSSIDDLSIYDLHILGNAALLAQHTNKIRNRIIREIDSLLGEPYTQLEKTY